MRTKHASSASLRAPRPICASRSKSTCCSAPFRRRWPPPQRKPKNEARLASTTHPRGGRTLTPPASACARTFLAAAAGCIALAAHAADPALLGKDMGIEPEKGLAETRLFKDVVVAPIPISNPTVGTGLAAV